MSATRPTRVLILGGGFGGVYTALHLEQMLADQPDVEITLVNRENFFLFTPMLHEVAASDIDLTHIANPIRQLLRRARFFHGTVEAIDLPGQRVIVAHGPHQHTHALEYDHLVIALGSITNFFNLPGLAEHALTMKSLGDAIEVRNRVIANLEVAATECAAGVRVPLLTFLVAGGGFAGVETIAAINDFAREALHHYPLLSEAMLRFVLVHPGNHILAELGEELGRYAQAKLEARGVDIRLNTRVTDVSAEGVTLNDGSRIETHLVIWTAGTAANPVSAMLPCAIERGRIPVNAYLEVPDYPGVYALGDCALARDPRSGEPYPPTAQHALRQGKVVAHNIAAAIRGGERAQFAYSTVGQLASIGRRTGVAKVFGRNISGFPAWWLWRTIYLSKLPRLEKKVRVTLDWTLDLLFSKDIVQYGTHRAPTVSMSTDAPTAPAARPIELAAPRA